MAARAAPPLTGACLKKLARPRQACGRCLHSNAAAQHRLRQVRNGGPTGSWGRW